MKDLGYFKGEKCNRNGCNGIIDEHEKEGECTTLILLAPIVPHKLHIAQSVAGVHQKKNTNII